MLHLHRLHGLALAELVGLGAFAEALARFLHSPHLVPAMNAVAALAVAIYTHAVRGRAAAPPIDTEALADALAERLRPRKPRLYAPDPSLNLKVPETVDPRVWRCECGRHTTALGCRETGGKCGGCGRRLVDSLIGPAVPTAADLFEPGPVS